MSWCSAAGVCGAAIIDEADEDNVNIIAANCRRFCQWLARAAPPAAVRQSLRAAH